MCLTSTCIEICVGYGVGKFIGKTTEENVDAPVPSLCMSGTGLAILILIMLVVLIVFRLLLLCVVPDVLYCKVCVRVWWTGRSSSYV